MELNDASAALSALGHVTRLSIFRQLVEAGPEGRTPGQIAGALSLPGATLSFHLKELTQAGLLTVRKKSRYMHYSASFDRMNAVLAYLTENCCSLGAACDPACAPKAAPARRRKRA